MRSTASPCPEGPGSTDTPPPPSNAGVAFNISNEETIRRLRAKGQPIRLFGESDKDRRLRLRALELIEEKGHERVGGQNDFRKALEDVESAERLMRDRNAPSSTADEGKGKKKDDSASAEGEIAVLDLALVKTDPDKLYPVIYYALKRALKEWGESMAERPGKEFTRWPIVSIHSLTINPRTCEKDASGKAGRCDTSAVCAVPQAPLQIITVKGMSAASLEVFFPPSGSAHRPDDVSRFRTTCCHVWQRSYTICKSVSTSEPMTRISASRLAMRLGQLELPWLGTSSLHHWHGCSFSNSNVFLSASPS